MAEATATAPAGAQANGAAADEATAKGTAAADVTGQAGSTDGGSAPPGTDGTQPPADGSPLTKAAFAAYPAAGTQRVELTANRVSLLNLKIPPMALRGIYRAILTPDDRAVAPAIGPTFVVQNAI